VEGSPGEEAPSLGTLDDMLRKTPYTGISLHGAPLLPREPGIRRTGDFEG